MPWFFDTPYDEESGRHFLVFVNQQYDQLAAIVWSAQDHDYVLWGAADEEGLRAILAESGSIVGFSLEQFLDMARAQLPELDRKRSRRRV